MTDQLLRYNAEQQYVLFDFETAHLNLAWDDNKPWQFACNIGTKDKIVSKKDFFIKWPKINVSADAAKITGYDAKIVKEKGIEPEDAIRQIDELIYDTQYKIVGHNLLGFDIYVHNMMRLLLGRKTDYSYLERVLDTNYLLKGWKLGLQPRPGESLIAYQMRLRNVPVRGVKTSVKVMCGEFGIEYPKNAHQADVDVRIQRDIFKQTLYKVDI